MVRQFSVILGIGLIVLWIAGLSSPFAPAWISWLDGAAGLLAFLIAGSNQQQPIGASARAQAGGPLALAIGLFALWVVALSTAVIPWMTWWTFAFACAFLALSVAVMGRRSKRMGTHEEAEVIEEERFKKSA